MMRLLLIILVFTLSLHAQKNTYTVTGEWKNNLRSGEWLFSATTNFSDYTTLSLFFSFEKQLITRQDVWVKEGTFDFSFKHAIEKQILSGDYTLQIYCPKDLQENNVFVENIFVGTRELREKKRKQCQEMFASWLISMREVLDFLENNKPKKMTEEQQKAIVKIFTNVRKLHQQISLQKNSVLKPYFSVTLNHFYKMTTMLLSIEKNYSKMQKISESYIRNLRDLCRQVTDTQQPQQNKSDHKTVEKELHDIYQQLQKGSVENIEMRLAALQEKIQEKELTAILYWLRVYSKLHTQNLSQEELEKKKHKFDLRLQLLFLRLRKTE